MRRTWRKAKPKQEKNFCTNNQIRSETVFLINELGEQKGETPTKEAIQIAQDAGLDLVEVNPKAEPPIVKIMDFGQFKYEKEKKAHKQKVLQKKINLKGIRLSVRISEHDLDLRLQQAIKFLKKGDKLKLELILKGREKAHPQKAKEIIENFVTKLKEAEGLNIEPEQDLTKRGGGFIMILLNKKD